MGSSALRKEFFVWIAIVWPVLITNISQTGMGLTDISFLGHYNRADPLDNSTSVSKSTTYVSAASLGNIYNSLMNVLIVKGINSAGQILISQALGAKNFRLAKSYLYVCLCLVTLFGMPIVLSYIWAGQILDYFSGLGEELTALTTSYTRTLAVGFIPFLWYQAFNSYLVSNHVTMPQMVLSMACFCLNLLFNALFLYGWGPDWAGFGFIGSPMATVGSRCVLCIGGFAIVRHLMSKHKKAQIPLSDMSESPPQAIEDGACTGITIERMKKLLLLGLPLSLSMLLEDGQLQFIAILAARIGKISIATHNSMLNFVWVLTSMMWAVSGATRVRVAFYLGAGNVEGAKRVIKIASVCGGGDWNLNRSDVHCAAR